VELEFLQLARTANAGLEVLLMVGALLTIEVRATNSCICAVCCRCERACSTRRCQPCSSTCW
jgi:hypothetical protein